MSLIRKGMLSISGSIAQVLVNFLSGIILARALTPEGLGQYSLVISLVTILGAICSLGLGNASIYYVNNKKRNPREIIPTAVKLSLLLAMLVFIISTCIFQLEEYFGSMTEWAIFFVAVYGFGIVVFENLLKIPLVFMRVGQFVTAKFIPGFIFLCLIGLGSAYSELSTHDAWFYVALGQIAGVLLLVYFIKDYLNTKESMKFTDVKAITTYGSKLNLTYIALLLHSEIGLFLVRYFTDDFTEVGYYRLAIRLAGILLIFPKSIGPLFFSRWSKARGDIRLLEVEQVSRIFYFLTFIGILFLELVANELVVFVYGAAYSQAVPVLRIILVGIGVRFILMPVFSLFSSSGNPLFSTYVYMSGLIVTVLLMCILIPLYGSLGAGIAFTVGFMIALFVCYYLAHRFLNLDLRKCFIMMPGDIRFLREKLSGV